MSGGLLAGIRDTQSYRSCWMLWWNGIPSKDCLVHDAQNRRAG
jgi:hypothetical protein